MKDYHRIDEMYQEALRLRNEDNIESALKLFKQITIEHPDYECGACFLDLDGCLDELGKLDEAEENYLKALEYDPYDIHRWNNYAVFLYSHRDFKKTFNYANVIKEKYDLKFRIIK